MSDKRSRKTIRRRAVQYANEFKVDVEFSKNAVIEEVAVKAAQVARNAVGISKPVAFMAAVNALLLNKRRDAQEAARTERDRKRREKAPLSATIAERQGART